MNEAVIRLDNFGFSFGEEPVLAGINFTLNQGESLQIIGPNGTGKSTLLRCILNLHEHGKSSGEIGVKNRPASSYKQRELAGIISYVPQAGGWVPPFTVEEFLRLSRYPRQGGGFAPARNQEDGNAVLKALQLTGLENLAGRSLRTLSGGERQRAYVAAALAQEAEVMLLDEPASFLDPKNAHDLNRVLGNLNQQGHQSRAMTFLTVTHDLNTAFSPPAARSKVLVLSQGRQVYCGKTEGLLDGTILRQAFSHEFIIFKHPRTGLPAVLND